MPVRRSPGRILLSGLLVSVVSLSGAACAGDEPLAPAELEGPAVLPATDIAPAGGDLAALTGPRIAFLSWRYNNKPNVFTMDPSGNNLVRLTNWSDDASSPAWSYDNKRLALVRPRYNPATNLRVDDIYLMNADGSNKHWARSALSSFHMRDPSWSPDGTKLVVTVLLPQSGSYLAQMNLATGTLNFVSLSAGGPIGRYAAYDPTGKKIIYVGKDDRSIERINTDGTGRTTLFSSATARYENPRYSPDGKRIAFVKTVNGDLELFVKNADGTVKRLTTSTFADADPTWSPDGSKIAFESSRTGDAQIWSVSSTGGTATRITHSSNLDKSPAYSH